MSCLILLIGYNRWVERLQNCISKNTIWPLPTFDPSFAYLPEYSTNYLQYIILSENSQFVFLAFSLKNKYRISGEKVHIFAIKQVESGEIMLGYRGYVIACGEYSIYANDTNLP